ncbi:hypothetical protein QE392_003477 [Microbacterium proteolyticum]|nr:hypothetical protein [Microbacterium proteolyticum]
MRRGDSPAPGPLAGRRAGPVFGPRPRDHRRGCARGCRRGCARSRGCRRGCARSRGCRRGCARVRAGARGCVLGAGAGCRPSRINTFGAQKHTGSVFPRTNRVYARDRTPGTPRTLHAHPGSHPRMQTPTPAHLADAHRRTDVLTHKHNRCAETHRQRVSTHESCLRTRPNTPGGPRARFDAHPRPTSSHADAHPRTHRRMHTCHRHPPSRINTIGAQKHTGSVFPRTNRVYARDRTHPTPPRALRCPPPHTPTHAHVPPPPTPALTHKYDRCAKTQRQRVSTHRSCLRTRRAPPAPPTPPAAPPAPPTPPAAPPPRRAPRPRHRRAARHPLRRHPPPRPRCSTRPRRKGFIRARRGISVAA